MGMAQQWLIADPKISSSSRLLYRNSNSATCSGRCLALTLWKVQPYTPLGDASESFNRARVASRRRQHRYTAAETKCDHFESPASSRACVRIATEPFSLDAQCCVVGCPVGAQVEGSMITLIDVIILLLAYAGLSLGCAALMCVLRALPQRDLQQVAPTKWK